MPMPATDDLNDHLLEGDEEFDEEEEEDEEEDKNDNSVVIEQDEYGRILFEKNKVDGALRHQLQFPSKSGANETFESLDYDKCENSLYRNRFIHISHSGLAEIKKFTLKYNTYRWILCGAIGCVTALVAVFVDFCTRLIMSNKFGVVSDHIKNCSEEFDGVRNFRCLFYPWWFLVLVNLACTLGAALLCLFISPAAAGGGIAEIKCFLNGVRRKDWLSFKTAFVKVLGVILAVGASLPVGKEGPMVHTGAIIGSGLPQGKSSRLGFNFNTLMFRNDRAKRDYVSVGVAAGVAAGFGAPIGGVLLSLEEGASFWNQGLTWRTLFTCMCTLVVLQLMMSGTIDKDEPGGGWGHLSSGGLADFGVFGKCGDEQLWYIQDLIVFAVMGCAGGLIGAMWNGINTRLVRFRLKYTTTITRKLIEAGIICIINTTVMFMGGMYLGSCQNLEELDQESILGGATVRQFFCREDQFNDMATISLSPLDKVIKQLFHRQGNFSLTTCFSFFAFTWILSCWTCGVAVPSGLFIPLLACGGAFGRFVGELCRTYLYHSVDTGTYALVGAAAILGGIVRMTISLTVILVETTNEVSLGLPILITLMLAKWCGDYFNEGIYDIHIKVKKIPLLGWEAEDEMKRYTVDDVMSKPVVCIQPVCRVSDIVHLLKTSAHNGFPVVDTFVHGVTFGGQNQGEDADTSCPVLGGKFIGLILRSQLITMLQDKCYGERIGDQTTQPQMTFNDFASRYPQRRKVEEIYIPPGINTLFMDVTPYMNPSPYTVQSGTPLPRVFNLYRTMGLRHIVVLDDLHYVVGMITRNELTEARIHDFNKEFEKMDKRI